MKKHTLLLALLLGLLSLVPACAEEPARQPSQWTVMFYFCGSDLESRHGFASENIKEISSCMTYDAVGSYFSGAQAGGLGMDAVNVVMETGGAEKWHADNLGMDVRTDVLQRWHFRPSTELVQRNSAFELAQEVPLASMARPETLTDFIRWSAENYPAEKYALVLWDHGLGALKGIFIDELFDGDSMPLYELKSALADSGVRLEAVLFDACLMASLETACAIKDSANWMIASEENVPGKGTAIRDWLQQLFIVPESDGEQLGRWICEMNMYKYAEEESEHDQNAITWSVLDLGRIDRVAKAFDGFFANCGNIYANGTHQYDMTAFCEAFNTAFEFGRGDGNMIDLVNIQFSPYIIMNLERDLYIEIMDALSEAVAYNTHGAERARAGGLSFCYATGFSAAELDQYALVCPSSHYLALLDAINPNWDAPAWVFEQAEKLPEIVEMPNYHIRVKKCLDDAGVPQITVMDGFRNLRYVFVDMLHLNPKTGNTVYLSDTIAEETLDESNSQVSYGLHSFEKWPALEGVLCTAQIADVDYINSRELFSIPLRMDGEIYMLRCGIEKDKPAVIYGLWEGHLADSTVYSRNVVPLSKVAGREYNLLYPIVDVSNGKLRYESSETLTMYRSLELSYVPLEPGTYYMEYYIADIFMRLLPVGRVEVQWDGQSVSVDESAWQGEVSLVVPED